MGSIEFAPKSDFGYGVAPGMIQAMRVGGVVVEAVNREPQMPSWVGKFCVPACVVAYPPEEEAE